jgi:hypothetical protein
MLALLLYRRWIIAKRGEFRVGITLVGKAHGGAYRVRAGALAALARAGLLAITQPGTRNRAPRVQLQFPKQEIPDFDGDLD